MEVDCGGGNQHVANSIGGHDVASAAPGVCTTTTATAFSTAAIHRPAATPRDGQLHSISTQLCSRRCAHLHCPRSGPAGTTLLWDVGSGILGSHPPHLVTGTFAETNPSSSHFRDSSSSASGKVPHLPKLEFPKFDGDNPCLLRDHCDMYFEVFLMSPDLKTATL